MAPTSGGGRQTALLLLAAAVPFLPDSLEFLRQGIPNTLFSGDGAALELGTLHAARLAQFVGPYSRFGWNHPGPAFFYLAVPLYELLGERGPALNLFVFLANYVTVVAIVLTARRLRGFTFATIVAALISCFALSGVPFLLANEWNPIFPMLPLVLLVLLSVQLSLGAGYPLPLFAFVASLIVQTHVGYVPAVCAIMAVPLISRWCGCGQAWGHVLCAARVRRWPTLTVLVACWILPLTETVIDPPGNLSRVVGFFLLRGFSTHSLGVLLSTVATQIAVLPWALWGTLRHTALAPPELPIAVLIALIESGGVIVALVLAKANGDAVSEWFARMTLGLLLVTIPAVLSIRGEILFYLTAWISTIGLMAGITFIAALLTRFDETIGTSYTGLVGIVGAVALIGLSVTSPVPRSPVIRQPDLETKQLADTVEAFLRSADVKDVGVYIASRETWPTAVAIILQLYKHGIQIHVEDEWVGIVGRPLAGITEGQPALFVGDSAFGAQAREKDDLARVADTDRIAVLYSRGLQ